MPVIQSGRPLRVAVAGFGQAGQCHAATWASMPDVTLVGVYSLRPEVEAADIAALCGAGVPVFADYERMLDETDCDFVSICTLHDTHAAQAIAAAERGKHFIVEKPICLTPEELFAVRRAVDKAGVRAFVGFQEFHYGQLQATIEAVRAGWLGRVHLAEIEYFNGIGPWVRQHWWARTRKIGGSSMLFCGCHPLMMMMLVMQGLKVAEVQAFTSMSTAPDFAGLEYPATQVNLIRFEDGRIGKVTSCLDSLHPYYWRNTLIGSEGSLIDTRLMSRVMLPGLEPRGWQQLATRSINDAGDITPEMFRPMVERILANLRRDEPMPYSGFDEAWEMHRVLFACEESANTGRPVSPDRSLPAP
ncbi:MAG: Gfo/Idh/MocA family oxidoreductase [Rhizobiales bacterium]|nr:Gfo/Idh/MocA family oxidoreductase [Hyphomicrobiales bacterium]